MICHDLQQIGLTYEALIAGNRCPDFKRDSDFNYRELEAFHDGKENSISHMLGGGNGFPQTSWSVMQAAFDAGCTIERRDLRSLQVWQRDLSQCLADRKRGRVA